MRLRVAPKAAFESRKVKIRVHLLIHNTISSADDPQLVPCAAWAGRLYDNCRRVYDFFVFKVIDAFT